MRILFVSALLPYPLHSGGQIRIFNLLRRLAKKHEVSLVAFIRDEKEESGVKHLSFCRKVELIWRGSGWSPKYLISALGKYPWLLATYNQPQSQVRLLAQIEDNYDLIHLEPFYVWPILPRTRLPVVVAEHNIEYQVYEDYVRRSPWVPLRPLMYADVLKLKFWEEHVWRKAHHLTAVSDSDRQAILKKVATPATVVPNGVDLSTFDYQDKKSRPDGPKLLFVGNLAWLPNQEAAKTLITQVWPQVLAILPQAQLRLIARNAPPRFIALAKRVGAELLTEVADIASEYHRADLLVAPLTIAGGTKFKILEAMAAGTVVITTQEGARGLSAKASIHCLLGQTPSELAAQVKVAWENKKLYDKLAQAARRLVEDNYSWDNIAKILDRVWRDAHEANKA